MNMTIENINKVTNQLIGYAAGIRQTVAQQIVLVGDKVVQSLQVKYPDLSITSTFYPQNLEYWVIITKLGQQLTWIKCPLSNLSFTRKRDEEGKQEFKSDAPVLNTDELVQMIADDLSLQINAALSGRLK
jgi:hypothetical protein